MSRETDAESIGRGYNYPHVVAAYWSMYRLGRNHNGPVTNHAWDWYLDQAYETIKFMFSRSPNGRRRVGYVDLGLMEGDFILSVFEDLKREGWNDKARVVEDLMKERETAGSRRRFPSAARWPGTRRDRKRFMRGASSSATTTKRWSHSTRSSATSRRCCTGAQRQRAGCWDFSTPERLEASSGSCTITVPD